MLKIGHRGAKGYVAENTLASFKKALELKVNGIELDVHLSSDAEIMVIHDETINRTTKGNGFVKDFTSVELKQLGIPTLIEVLDLINQECFVNIEIKDVKTTKLVVELIQNYLSKKHWNIEKFIVSSFDWTVLKEISQLNSTIKIGVLTEDNIDDAIAFAKEIKAFSINPYFKLLTIDIVERIQKEGFQIHTWTVNSLEDITFVKSLNVDGIISDFPDKI
ncbi:glycerophosphodiester phosphodiesterase [Flavobacterium sp.]|uniref:glycerophosphodiester phosphodiesterase n=1 Tax=Flavobacterium sp. TaxID=239 RepID=UPI0038FC79B5